MQNDNTTNLPLILTDRFGLVPKFTLVELTGFEPAIPVVKTSKVANYLHSPVTPGKNKTPSVIRGSFI